MYIFGGVPVKKVSSRATRTVTTGTVTTTQAFMIDLTVPWDVKSPAYKKLPSGPILTTITPRGGWFMSTSSAITADRQNWFILTANENTGSGNGSSGGGGVGSSSIGYLYNFRSRSWKRVVLDESDPGNTHHRQHRLLLAGSQSGVTDLDTGIIYILLHRYDDRDLDQPAGGVDGDRDGDPESDLPTLLLSVDISTKTLKRVKGAPSSLAVDGITWSAYRKDLLYSVSSSGAVTSSDIFAYKSNSGWKNLDTTITATTTTTITWPFPTGRRQGSSCFVPAFGGSKMILFGGLSEEDGFAFSDIDILDVTTLTWTKGPNVSQLNARGYSACAVSGEYFISWGGINRELHPVNGDTTITTTTTTTKITTAGARAILPLDAVIVFSLASGTWVSGYTPPGTERTPVEPALYNYINFKMCLHSGHCREFMIGSAVIGGFTAVLAVVGWLVYRARRRHHHHHARQSRNNMIVGNHLDMSESEPLVTYV
ncbi:hypothetical protein BGZ65_008628 [Modicella reniformis]|uniref:Uncharacterized protein n=1 Tax=Modicella reniformis TaxID=1440133 RepID=A0A9P6SVC1_9FUNG|nr:hypothetical protein BGZ65_008628 [Modicella reniformis]